MKSLGYTILALISLIVVTPNSKVREVEIEPITIEYKSHVIDSLKNISDVKTDSLEYHKEKLRRLQIELGIRK